MEFISATVFMSEDNTFSPDDTIARTHTADEKITQSILCTALLSFDPVILSITAATAHPIVPSTDSITGLLWSAISETARTATDTANNVRTFPFPRMSLYDVYNSPSSSLIISYHRIGLILIFT